MIEIELEISYTVRTGKYDGTKRDIVGDHKP